MRSNCAVRRTSRSVYRNELTRRMPIRRGPGTDGRAGIFEPRGWNAWSKPRACGRRRNGGNTGIRPLYLETRLPPHACRAITVELRTDSEAEVARAGTRPAFGDRRTCTQLQRDTFRYFWEETHPENGLMAGQHARRRLPASIAAVGHALAAYAVGVERRFVTRAEGWGGRLRRCAFSGTARKGKSRTRPATRVFTTTSST